MKTKRNSAKYPDAWKIFIDCVRKWEETDLSKYPEGWKYGIPDPKNPNEYLYENCPGKLFNQFRIAYYESPVIVKFRKFLWWLDDIEGKGIKNGSGNFQFGS